MTDDTAGGLESLHPALAVLAFLTARDGTLGLPDIARGCGMPASRVHRSVASFVAAGLMRQEGRSRRYDLGPEAVRLGLAALARLDVVTRAADGLPELARRTSMTVRLAAWGGGAATVVRWERGAAPTVTSIGRGTSLPLPSFAAGRVFLAWAPRPAIRDALDGELRRAARNAAPCRTPRRPVRASPRWSRAWRREGSPPSTGNSFPA